MKRLLCYAIVLGLCCLLAGSAMANIPAVNVNGPGATATVTQDVDGTWYPEGDTWRNDDNARFPSFEDVLDYIGIWICGWYGCLGEMIIESPATSPTYANLRLAVQFDHRVLVDDTGNLARCA